MAKMTLEQQIKALSELKDKQIKEQPEKRETIERNFEKKKEELIANSKKETSESTSKKETKSTTKKEDDLIEHTKKVAQNTMGAGAIKEVKKLGKATNKEGKEVDAVKGVTNQVKANSRATQAYDKGSLTKTEDLGKGRTVEDLQNVADEIADEGKTTGDYTPPTKKEVEDKAVEVMTSDKENNFKQVETITSQPEVEQAAADMGLDMDNPPDDPKLAQQVGESELKKSGLPDDLVSKLVNAFVPSKDGSKKDVKSELADALKDKQEQLNELSKTGMGDKICGILTVLSAIATLATGGAIPPVNFVTVKDIITDPRGYLQQNRKFNIEEKQKDISSANETIRNVEQKDINYKADQEQIKNILADHPDWTEEQATDFYYNKIKRNVELSQEQVTKDVELARSFVDEAFTSPDDAYKQAQEYRNQALKYRQAIRELSTANIDKQVELMQSLVPTLGQLDTSINTAGSSSGKSIQGGAKAGKLTKFLIEPNISGGLSFSNEASSTNSRMSREGVNKANDLYKQYLTSSSDATKQFKEALEDAANKCEAIANQFEEQAKATSKNFDANKYTSNINKYPSKVNSDTRKKHVYISKEDREAVKNSINNKKYQYIPKEKR